MRRALSLTKLKIYDMEFIDKCKMHKGNCRDQMIPRGHSSVQYLTVRYHFYPYSFCCQFNASCSCVGSGISVERVLFVLTTEYQHAVIFSLNFWHSNFGKYYGSFFCNPKKSFNCRKIIKMTSCFCSENVI